MILSSSPSPFRHVEELPRDPVLGITEGFLADTNPRRVNLGVGVYQDETGKVPLLACIAKAEEAILAKAAAHSYIPIDGIAAYNNAVTDLIFGAGAQRVAAHVVTVQALGGTGALKLGADFLKIASPGARVWISDPSWENHRALFSGAGFDVQTYPYYTPSGEVAFEEMIEKLNALPAGDVVVLHACCHNPTGLDLDAGQWDRVIDSVRSRDLIPFLDMAYMGFAEGLEEDRAPVHAFARSLGAMLVASSFSKSMSLYGERVGALSIVAESADERARILSQVKRVARTTYSSPPGHGAASVAMVLADPELRALWTMELTVMRERIKAMRHALADKLAARMPGRDFSYITRQRGMFSYSGLSKEAVGELRTKHSIYALDSGRICVAALNGANIDVVADAIAEVMHAGNAAKAETPSAA